MAHKVAKNCEICMICVCDLYKDYRGEKICADCLYKEYNDVCGFLNKSFDEIKIMTEKNKILEKRLKELKNSIIINSDYSSDVVYG